MYDQTTKDFSRMLGDHYQSESEHSLAAIVTREYEHNQRYKKHEDEAEKARQDYLESEEIRRAERDQVSRDNAYRSLLRSLSK